MKIKEVIVVEGKSDTIVIQNAVNADTIETNGSEISRDTIERIKLAQEKRGVIIFTDPDYPGERIRKIISNEVPGCKHAFLPKKEAIALNKKSVGVEHASKESIREALRHIKEEFIEETEKISWNDLLAAGLIGGQQAKARREKLGKLLKIGYMNGKQLHKRLLMFQISEQQFAEAMSEILQEEQAR